MKRYQTTGYHLALAHLIEDPHYVSFYQERSDEDFVILDNSVIELGKPVEYEELLKAVFFFTPDELVLCDFPEDPEATYDWAKRYGPYFKENYPSMKLMVVPQWRYKGVVENWMSSLIQLSMLEFVDTIGIPKFLGSHRPQVCAMLDKNEDIRNGLEFHLLGTWENPLEVKELAKYDWIRGVDSKIPVRLGQQGIALDPVQGLLANRYELPPLDFDNDSDPMPIITSHNCKVYRQWAEGKKAEVLKLGK